MHVLHINILCIYQISIYKLENKFHAIHNIIIFIIELLACIEQNLRHNAVIMLVAYLLSNQVQLDSS